VTNALTSGDLLLNDSLQHSKSYFGGFTPLPTHTAMKLQNHWQL